MSARYCLYCQCRLPSRWKWWHDICKACLRDLRSSTPDQKGTR